MIDNFLKSYFFVGDFIIAATDTINTDVINLKDDSYQCRFADYPYRVNSAYYRKYNQNNVAVGSFKMKY